MRAMLRRATGKPTKVGRSVDPGRGPRSVGGAAARVRKSSSCRTSSKAREDRAEFRRERKSRDVEAREAAGREARRACSSRWPKASSSDLSLLIIKADVQGSGRSGRARRCASSPTDEGERVRSCIGAVGAHQPRRDVNLAIGVEGGSSSASTRARTRRRCKLARKRAACEIRYYNIIYNAVDEVKARCQRHARLRRSAQVVTGIGRSARVVIANVRRSAHGRAVWCTDGFVKRQSSSVRVLRNNVVIHTRRAGFAQALQGRREGSRVRASSAVCRIKNFNDIVEGDQFEVFEVTEVARTPKSRGTFGRGGAGINARPPVVFGATRLGPAAGATRLGRPVWALPLGALPFEALPFRACCFTARERRRREHRDLSGTPRPRTIFCIRHNGSHNTMPQKRSSPNHATCRSPIRSSAICRSCCARSRTRASASSRFRASS